MEFEISEFWYFMLIVPVREGEEEDEERGRALAL